MIDWQAEPEAFLRQLFAVAVDAADPRKVLADYLPEDRTGPALVIGAGKATAAMAASVEQHWQGPLEGLVVTRYGHGLPGEETCQRIEIIEASHPVPDENGREAARRILDKVCSLTADTDVLCLISGGGSSLLSQPVTAISFTDKQRINRELLRSGAAIDQINCVRKHLSAVKGGRLAQACHPARVTTLAISDVPGDEPSTIASGPTVGDPTSSDAALAVIDQYAQGLPEDLLKRVNSWLQSPESETPFPQDKLFQGSAYHLIATPAMALKSAQDYAEQAGLSVLSLGDQIEGESRLRGAEHGALVQQIIAGQHAIKPPCLLVSGGETTVTIKGKGKGGPNTEYLLALANALDGQPGVYALSADTDGIDGSEDNAGALISPQTLAGAAAQGLEIQSCLDDNDAYSFFEPLGDLLITGPTLTNVNDFRAILVLS